MHRFGELTRAAPLRLGLLSLAESAASTDGALISSLSIPFFALACGAPLLRVKCAEFMA